MTITTKRFVRVSKLLAVSLSLFMFNSYAETLKILEYVNSSVALLDEEAGLIKKVDAATLPGTPVEVLSIDTDLEIVKIKDKSGNEIWLDTMDVKLNKGKGVVMPCVALNKNEDKSSMQAGTLGYGKSCSKEK